MLKIICGKAGTGKSTRLRENIAKDAVDGKKTLLFVPDQFSFESEKLIYKTVPHGSSDNCRVTTFAKEAQRILRKYAQTKEYADDIAKRIVIKRALEEASLEGSLVYYKGQLRKQGFPAFALGMISDMRSAGISPSALRGKLANGITVSASLEGKLNDIAVIYSAYDRILTENFDDRLDDVRRAADLILQTDAMDGCEVYLDEFDGFSGNQLAFISAMLDKAESVTLALTCDYPDCKDRKFKAVNNLIADLKKKSDTVFDVQSAVRRDPKELTVVQARDKWQECDWICAEIRALTDSGVRCRDIAVLVPDSGTTRILDSALRKYDIPAFADIPEPLISKSFVRFCVSTLRALSFETDDILRYVKSGYVRNLSGKIISDTQTDKLEMLCRTYDLRRRDWLKPFPEGIDDSGELEELRKSIIDPLRTLKKAAEDADGAELTELLCDFICNKTNIYKTIYGKCIIGRNDDGSLIVDRRKLDDYSELWDDTVTVLESAHKALAGSRMPLNEYTEILTDAFTAVTVAKPPQTLDAVTVGDTERSRFTDVKYVFLCGFNQGIMPPPARISEVFTPSETEQLTTLGIPTVADRLSRYSQELFTLYRCTHIPSKRLYITYPLLSENESFLEPAAAIKEIVADFSGKEGAVVTQTGADSFGAKHYCRTENAAMRYLAKIYSDRSRRGERKALTKLVQSEYTDMLASAAGETPNRERHRLKKEYATSLLTLNSYSPSAITLLGKCKFAFFCRYGLGLRDDDERRIDSRVMGDLVHFCLQRLLTDYLDKREEFTHLTDDQISAHIAESINIFEKERYFSGFGGTVRFSYMLHRLGEYALKAAKRMRDETAQSQFYPVALEKKLSFDFGGITVAGICDRTDERIVGGKRYIRVVDYKHNSQIQLTLDEVYRGENLQMLLYLFGLCAGSPDAAPSSALYYPFGNAGLIKGDDMDDDTAALESSRTYQKDHAPRGIILTDSPESSDVESINAALRDKYKSPRTTFYKPALITPEVYGAVQSYCGSYLSSKVLETRSGMLGACPSNSHACKYCNLSPFCGGGGTPAARGALRA